MEIRDVIHGSIQIESLELPIIESRYFQRLRQIKQLGFAENSFPSATHNRLIHSLGAMNAATQVFEGIVRQKSQHSTPWLPSLAYDRFRAVVRLAALLHDIGHGPLSHTTEFAMPKLKDLGLSNLNKFKSGKTQSRKATHEDYTLKIILDSDLTPLIEKAGQAFSMKPHHVAALIDPELEVPDTLSGSGAPSANPDFFLQRVSTERGSEIIDFKPLLRQIISSEMDADRMDYLRRDSLHAGVSYGQFDFEWLVGNLTAHFENGKCYLCLQHRALYAFEDFLISRFHMFLMIYFHHKSVIFDELLAQYFSSPDCDYKLPSDIGKYCDFNDAHLYAHLSQSSNEWARRIVEKKPYQLLIELHSGIPATPSTHLEQQKLLCEIKENLKKQGIHFLVSTSTSELSKYFRRPGDPIFVRYDNLYSTPRFIPLEQCTDLFQRYHEKRSITRLYVSPENLSRAKALGSPSNEALKTQSPLESHFHPIGTRDDWALTAPENPPSARKKTHPL